MSNKIILIKKEWSSMSCCNRSYSMHKLIFVTEKSRQNDWIGHIHFSLGSCQASLTLYHLPTSKIDICLVLAENCNLIRYLGKLSLLLFQGLPKFFLPNGYLSLNILTIRCWFIWFIWSSQTILYFDYTEQ